MESRPKDPVDKLWPRYKVVKTSDCDSLVNLTSMALALEGIEEPEESNTVMCSKGNNVLESLAEQEMMTKDYAWMFRSDLISNDYELMTVNNESLDACEMINDDLFLDKLDTHVESVIGAERKCVDSSDEKYHDEYITKDNGKWFSSIRSFDPGIVATFPGSFKSILGLDLLGTGDSIHTGFLNDLHRCFLDVLCRGNEECFENETAMVFKNYKIDESRKCYDPGISVSFIGVLDVIKFENGAESDNFSGNFGTVCGTLRCGEWYSGVSQAISFNTVKVGKINYGVVMKHWFLFWMILSGQKSEFRARLVVLLRKIDVDWNTLVHRIFEICYECSKRMGEWESFVGSKEMIGIVKSASEDHNVRTFLALVQVVFMAEAEPVQLTLMWLNSRPSMSIIDLTSGEEKKNAASQGYTDHARDPTYGKLNGEFNVKVVWNLDGISVFMRSFGNDYMYYGAAMILNSLEVAASLVDGLYQVQEDEKSWWETIVIGMVTVGEQLQFRTLIGGICDDFSKDQLNVGKESESHDLSKSGKHFVEPSESFQLIKGMRGESDPMNKMVNIECQLEMGNGYPSWCFLSLEICELPIWDGSTDEEDYATWLGQVRSIPSLTSDCEKWARTNDQNVPDGNTHTRSHMKLCPIFSEFFQQSSLAPRLLRLTLRGFKLFDPGISATFRKLLKFWEETVSTLDQMEDLADHRGINHHHLVSRFTSLRTSSLLRVVKRGAML